MERTLERDTDTVLYLSTRFDDLARRYLVAGRFKTVLGGEVPFPGESGARFYEMEFSLPGVALTADERLIHGQVAVPGLRMFRVYEGYPEKAWSTVFQKVVLKNGKYEDLIWNLILPSDGDGEWFFSGRRGVEVVEPLEQKWILSELGSFVSNKDMRLISAGFMDKVYGNNYQLKLE